MFLVGLIRDFQSSFLFSKILISRLLVELRWKMDDGRFTGHKMFPVEENVEKVICQNPSIFLFLL